MRLAYLGCFGLASMVVNALTFCTRERILTDTSGQASRSRQDACLSVKTFERNASWDGARTYGANWEVRIYEFESRNYDGRN